MDYPILSWSTTLQNLVILNCFILLGPHRFNESLREKPQSAIKMPWLYVWFKKYTLKSLEIHENLICYGYCKMPFFNRLRCLKFCLLISVMFACNVNACNFELYYITISTSRILISWNVIQVSRSVMSNSLWPHEPQSARPPCPSPTHRVYPNPCPLSRRCHPTISSSVFSFSSCPQSFPASGSFPMSQLFTSGGQNIGVSASTSILTMNTQDWFPLGLILEDILRRSRTGWIFLESKGLSRVFSNTTVQKHQFFCAQLSL